MITIVAHLYISEGCDDLFRDYEGKALEVFRRHGGSLLVAAQPGQDAEDAPDEIHVLQIGSEQAFQSFREDPDLAALQSLRARVIRRTDIYVCPTAVDYPA